MSWNVVVSPDNTTYVHISSLTSALHFMILWGEVSWNILASLPMKSCWNNAMELFMRTAGGEYDHSYSELSVHKSQT